MEYYLTQTGTELVESSRGTQRLQRKADVGVGDEASLASKIADRLERYKDKTPPMARPKNVASSNAELDAYNAETIRLVRGYKKHGKVDPEVVRKPRTTKVMRRAASRNVG